MLTATLATALLVATATPASATVQDGVAWFGDATTPVTVVSVPPAEPARCGELRRAMSEIDAEIARRRIGGSRLRAVARRGSGFPLM